MLLNKVGLLSLLLAGSVWACGSDAASDKDTAPGNDTAQGDLVPQDGAGGTDTLPGDATDSVGTPDTGDTEGEDTGPLDTLSQDTQALDTLPQDSAGVDAVDPTYTAIIQPLFDFHCGACHSGNDSNDCSGVTCFASQYQHNLVNSVMCSGKTVGECALDLIEAGSMPPGCPTCVTAEDKAWIRAWIDAGMPE